MFSIKFLFLQIYIYLHLLHKKILYKKRIFRWYFLFMLKNSRDNVDISNFFLKYKYENFILMKLMIHILLYEYIFWGVICNFLLIWIF